MNTLETKYFLSQNRSDASLLEEIRKLEVEIITLCRLKKRKYKQLWITPDYEAELNVKITEMETKTRELLRME